MDYSKAALNDDEVNSSPSKSRVASVSSPSPLRPRRVFGSPGNESQPALSGKAVVCDKDVPYVQARRSMVNPETPFPRFLQF